jgi:hypothetical protein
LAVVGFVDKVREIRVREARQRRKTESIVAANRLSDLKKSRSWRLGKFFDDSKSDVRLTAPSPIVKLGGSIGEQGPPLRLSSEITSLSPKVFKKMPPDQDTEDRNRSLAPSPSLLVARNSDASMLSIGNGKRYGGMATAKSSTSASKTSPASKNKRRKSFLPEDNCTEGRRCVHYIWT